MINIPKDLSDIEVGIYKSGYSYCESLVKVKHILSIGFRPEDTTSEQMLNCIRNLIDIGIIAKDDASS